jgi:opacity protein-like surface antigen
LPFLHRTGERQWTDALSVVYLTYVADSRRGVALWGLNMRKVVLAAVAVFAAASAANAQNFSALSAPMNAGAFSGPSAWTAPVSLSQPSALLGNSLAEVAGLAPAFSANSAFPSLAGALPTPDPEPFFGHGPGQPWQVGAGYEFVRFRSSAFNANLSGFHTSLTYFPNEWFGIEGSVVAAFGGTIFANDRTKYLLYTVGPRIAWRGPKWQPWAHVLVGGLHILPQVADQGKNGFAVQAGGGADYRITDNLGARFQADYVRSQLYSSGQNSFQFGAGFVIQF